MQQVFCVSFNTRKFRGNLTFGYGVISVDTVQPWTIPSDEVVSGRMQGGL